MEMGDEIDIRTVVASLHHSLIYLRPPTASSSTTATSNTNNAQNLNLSYYELNTM